MIVIRLAREQIYKHLEGGFRAGRHSLPRKDKCDGHRVKVGGAWTLVCRLILGARGGFLSRGLPVEQALRALNGYFPRELMRRSNAKSQLFAGASETASSMIIRALRLSRAVQRMCLLEK